MAKQLAFVGVGHIRMPGFIRMLDERSDVAVKLVWDHDAERALRCAGNSMWPSSRRLIPSGMIPQLTR